MRIRPHRPYIAALTALLLGYVLMSGLARAARSPRPFTKPAAAPVAASKPPRKPPGGSDHERLYMGACYAVAGLLTAAWGAFLIYLGAKLIGAVL